MKQCAPSWLSPEWLCGNSCIWAYDVRSCIVGNNEPSILHSSCFSEI